MTIDIRRIREEETPAWLESLQTAFLERFDADVVAGEVKPLWDYDRVWAALDGADIVGTLRSWGSELTVPGGARLPASAVAAVTVRGTHRRRGILSRLLPSEHQAARERGEAVGMLYASEYPIYGRFGYGSAVRTATWTLDSSATGAHGSAGGGVEFMKPSEAAIEAIKGVFEAWRARQPGEIRRRDFSWEVDLGLFEESGPKWKGFLAVHRDGSGEVDGYVRYRTEEKWTQRQPRNVINVDELHALTDDAYASLWRFLVDIDLVTTVKAERRHVAERLPWLLTNARAAQLSDVGDGLWLLLLDVPRALTARGYEREGRIVLETIDRPGTDAETRTRVSLDAAPAGTTCTLTDQPPDLTLHLGALGAAYLGGARLRDAVLPFGVDEHRAGALAQADALLATSDPPWCSTFF